MKYENDPYQIEYALIQDVEILREGKWNWYEYGREFMEEIALTYDPSMLRAKVIKDHEYEGPAFGHVLALRVADDSSSEGAYKLVATTGFLYSGKQMVESGDYNERSIGWASFHPTQGFPYLWEWSLLGANTPAAVGMDPIIFKEEESEVLMQRLAIDRANEGLSEEAIAKQLTWEKTEEYIRYRVRHKSRFRDETLKTIELDEDGGILAVVGKLKPDYVGDGNKESLVIQSVMFSLKKEWTLAKAKAWVETQELTEKSIVISNVTALQDIPVADIETAWDAVTAESHYQELAKSESGFDWNTYRAFHLWCNPEAKEDLDGCKLPIVDVVDGELKVIPKALEAASETLSDIPDEDVEAVKSRIAEYMVKLEGEKMEKNLNNSDSQNGISISDTNILNEGGSKMAENAVEEKKPTDSTIVVEAGSTTDLSKRNVELRLEAERREQEAQARLKNENEELVVSVENARRETIRSQVRTMQAEGFIAGPQVEMGLAEALSTVSDKETIKVGDKLHSPLSILMAALKYGGKLKLKLEVARDILTDSIDDPLAKARAAGIDTSVEERRIQLMEKNPNMSWEDALDRAYREVKPQ